jgi:DNA helicase-2/ATP-dependent DNA helicase PcrA
VPVASEQPKIVVLTFTNAAAREFRTRLESCNTEFKYNQSQWNAFMSDAPQIVVMSGPGSGKTMTALARVKRLGGASFVGTLHAYCFRLLRLYGHNVGFGNFVTIISEQEAAKLIEQTAVRLKLKKDDPLVRQDYLFTLRHNNVVDYDGLLRYGRHLLDYEEVRQAERCAHLVVEEAQDSAEIDWSIYFRIPADNRFIIGDVDQSVFEWRKAFPEGLLNVARDPASTVFKLEENYRCASSICSAANHLIEHNKSRYEKVTRSATDQMGGVEVHTFNDAGAELLSLANCVGRRCHAAVLCRTNHQVGEIAQYLASSGIKFDTVGNTFEGRPPDWQRALLLIGLAASPYNELLAEQLLLLDHDPHEVAKWKRETVAQGKNLSYLLPSTPPTDKINGSDVLKFLGMNNVSVATIELIRSRAQLLPEDATLSDLLQDLSSREMFGKKPSTSNLYVGTIHSAKGREWDYVFLPGFEEGTIPLGTRGLLSQFPSLKDHPNAEGIEEERRLAYVAITRARTAVFISWCARRQPRWGDVTECVPSRFIAELLGNRKEANEHSSS